ncbi:MAG TPA: PAS domain S-box protein [Urbifossiella sp.]|nr:PAS domain S-box protein [Urbifossiella sp.]
MPTDSRGAEFARQLADPDTQAAEFRTLFDHSLNGVAYCAVDGTFMRVNPAFCHLLGYSSRELVGRKKWQDVTHPDDVPAFVSEAEATAAGDQDEYTIDKRYLRKDGYSVYARVQVNRIPAGRGQFVHFLKQAQEIRLPANSVAVGCDTDGHPVLTPIVPVYDFIRRNWKWVAGTVIPVVGGIITSIGMTAQAYYEAKAENAAMRAEIKRLTDRFDAHSPTTRP